MMWPGARPDTGSSRRLDEELLWPRHNLTINGQPIHARLTPHRVIARDPVARFAAEGVPLGAVLAAYGMGLRVMWHAVLADAGPDDLADALAATDLVLRYREIAVSVVATAYAEERRTIVGHEREARRELLSALLDPLQDNPDLLPTLELYLAEGLNRRRTAALLHVHPNTVDYRPRRIVALTGLDPGNPGDLQHIGAAFAARRVRAGAPESGIPEARG